MIRYPFYPDTSMVGCWLLGTIDAPNSLLTCLQSHMNLHGTTGVGEEVVAHMQGCAGLSAQVGYPAMEVVMQSHDKTAFFAVECMGD